MSIASIKLIAILVGLVAVFGGGWLVLRHEYQRGVEAGIAKTKAAVQDETIKKTDDAVKRKDAVDEEVSKIPYKKLVDELK